MGIKFRCPNGHKMNVKSFLAGKRGKCPKCGASVRIPKESAAAEPAAADEGSGEDLLGGAEPETSAAAATAVAAQPTNSATVRAATVTPVVAPAPVTAAAVRPVHSASAAAMAAPGIPVGAPAIPGAPLMQPGYLPTGPAVMPVPGGVPFAGDPIAQAPNAIWYVRPPSGGQYGPARGEMMRKWVAEGRVSGDSLVWREGFPEWKTAGQLFPALASVSAPAPPPPEPAESPNVSRAVRKLSTYEARRSQGNGLAIAILVLLGIICILLVGGLAWVLSQTNNEAPSEPVKKTVVKTSSAEE